MKALLLLVFFLNGGVVAATDPPAPEYTIGRWQFRTTGETDWTYEWPSATGAYDLTFSVGITSERDPLGQYELLVSMLAATEVFWDGVLIGKSGIVGSSAATETPGPVYAAHHIPDTLLTPGDHQVFIRLSNFRAEGNVRFYGAYIANAYDSLTDSLWLVIIVHIYAGFFLIIGVYYLVRFLVGRKDTTLLVFALSCLAFFGLLMVEYIKNYLFYPYPWHFTRLRVILVLTQCIGLGLPLFVALRLNIRYFALLFVLQSGVFVLMAWLTRYSYDYFTNASMVFSFALASGLSLSAWRRQQAGSRIMVLAFVPVTLALILGFRYYDFVLYLGFGHVVLLMLISLAIQERDTLRQRENALLQSTRLELELLKKNIQPHFLMNSLASAIDWMEEQPRQGVAFLLALSREFELLLNAAGKPLIPLGQELELCRTHLQLMGFRKLKIGQARSSDLSLCCLRHSRKLTGLRNGDGDEVRTGKAGGKLFRALVA